MKRQNRQEYVQQMTVNWFLISLDLHWTPGGKELATLVHRICKAAADGPVSSTIQAELFNSSWTDFFVILSQPNESEYVVTWRVNSPLVGNEYYPPISNILFSKGKDIYQMYYENRFCFTFCFIVRHKNQISPADKRTFPDISNIDQKSYFVEHWQNNYKPWGDYIN